jgi:hypothetical protein
MPGKSQTHFGRRQIDECRQSRLSEFNLLNPSVIEAHSNASWVTSPEELAEENQNFLFFTNASSSHFRATGGIILIAKYRVRAVFG